VARRPPRARLGSGRKSNWQRIEAAWGPSYEQKVPIGNRIAPPKFAHTGIGTSVHSDGIHTSGNLLSNYSSDGDILDAAD
jgi:hypothetical protein